MASFDENGKYIKTNWKAGDKITATKLNKIEESIEAVNDNDISRHVEADARLDALEAKDVAHDKEFTNVKNIIADNKAAAELGDYEINSRMQFLEQELNEGIEEVHNVASTVDEKIATAEANLTAQVNTAKSEMTAQVNQGKADMEAMVTEVEGELNNLITEDARLESKIDILRTDVSNTIMITDITTTNETGYLRLGNGIIFQWGRVIFGAGYTQTNVVDYTVTFPITFPSHTMQFYCSASGGENGWNAICLGSPLAGGGAARIVLNGLNPNVSNTVYWFAIGI